jgi:hypothetical protein
LGRHSGDNPGVPQDFQNRGATAVAIPCVDQFRSTLESIDLASKQIVHILQSSL